MKYKAGKSETSAFNSFRQAKDGTLQTLREVMPARISKLVIKRISKEVLQMLIITASYLTMYKISESLQAKVFIIGLEIAAIVIFSLVILTLIIGMGMVKDELQKGNVYLDKVEYLGVKNGLNRVKPLSINTDKIFSFEEKLINIDGRGKGIVKGKQYTVVIISRQCNDDVLYVDFIQNNELLEVLNKYLVL